MLLSVSDVFSTARQPSQTLKYTLKARNKAPAQQSFLDNLIGCCFAVRSRRVNVPALSDLKTTATSAMSIQALEEDLFTPPALISGHHFVDPSSFVEAVA